MSAPDAFRSGTIAVLGRPNVGKSTLVNALVGYKVSIVAPKPQTTRHRILGILTREHAQFVFADTPGLHGTEGRAINRHLNRAARGSLADADIAMLVVEAGRWLADDDAALQVARDSGLPVVLVPNKIDRIERRASMLPFLQQAGARHAFAAVVPVSASKADGLERLEKALLALLPERGASFESDAVTDKSERFIAAELIREQVVRQLHDELPYATTVEVESFAQEDGLLRIGAAIWVEREGQKGIVVGAGGEQVKHIGTSARRALERQFDTRVFLQLWVRVREGWSDDERALHRFGYTQ